MTGPDGEPTGARSRRLLAELQERALANRAATVVLVEGLSDCLAVDAAAHRCGHDLRAAGIDVVPMGGATNIGHFLEVFGPHGRDARLAGLCDLAEQGLFARHLERAGVADRVDRARLEGLGFFVCTRDLEDELVRAVGPREVEAIIEREGELASLRALQQMPFHRHRSLEEHLHRFMGVRAGRKHRYAPLLAAGLDPSAMPGPLRGLLAHLFDAGAPR